MDQNNKTSLSSIGQLFSQSWYTFTHSLLQLILLNILGIVIYVILAVLGVLILILTGIGSSILQKGITGLSTISPSTLTSLGIMGIIFFILFLIIASALQVTSILIVDDNGQSSFGGKFRKSFGYILPLFFINSVAGILIIGGFFLLVIPGILIAILLSFVSLEVILGSQKSLLALRRSAAIISKNFGGIFIRLLVLFLINIGTLIVFNILSRFLPENSKLLMGIVSYIFNIGWSWFSLSFIVNLYKQARSSLDENKIGSIVWIWIVSILGWLVAVGIFLAMWKVISSGILNNLIPKTPARPGVLIQKSVNEMKPAAKVHFDKSDLLFKQIRENQNDPEKVNINRFWPVSCIKF